MENGKSKKKGERNDDTHLFANTNTNHRVSLSICYCLN